MDKWIGIPAMMMQRHVISLQTEKPFSIMKVKFIKIQIFSEKKSKLVNSKKIFISYNFMNVFKDLNKDHISLLHETVKVTSLYGKEN